MKVPLYKTTLIKSELYTYLVIMSIRFLKLLGGGLVNLSVTSHYTIQG